MTSTSRRRFIVSELGNCFASIYYSNLQDKPLLFFLPYSDLSTRVQIDGVMTYTAITEQGISVLAGPLFYNKIDLKTVNTIQSGAENMLMMTYGTATDAAGLKRAFVETFLLARQSQGHGFFVLNDIFQFIDGQNAFEQHHAPISSGNIYPPHQASVLSEDNHDNHGNRLNPSSSLPVPSGNTEGISVGQMVKVEQQQQRDSAKEVAVEKCPREETATMSQGGANAVGNPPATDFSYFSNPSGPSYLSVFRRSNRQFSPSVAAQSSAQQSNVGLSVTPASRGREAQERLGVGQRQSKRIIVRNLPQGITGADIFQLFSEVGRIEPSSVNIMGRPETAHSCTAYLNFQESADAQKAIKASPIKYNGQNVYVEEAKERSKGFDSEGSSRRR